MKIIKTTMLILLTINIAYCQSDFVLYHNSNARGHFLDKKNDLFIYTKLGLNKRNYYPITVSYSPIEHFGVAITSDASQYGRDRLEILIGGYLLKPNNEKPHISSKLSGFIGAEFVNNQVFNAQKYIATLGYHHKIRRVTFSLISDINLIDVRNMTIPFEFRNRGYEEDLEQNDPFVLLSFKPRAVFHFPILFSKVFIQYSFLRSNSDLIIAVQPVTTELGLAIDLSALFLKNSKKISGNS